MADTTGPSQPTSDTLEGQKTKNTLAGEPTPKREGSGPGGRTAYDVKEFHTSLGLTKDALKQIPVVDAGERLHQGSTYVDLSDLESGPFTATAEQKSEENQHLVRKSDVAYEIWNRLTGQEKPGQDFDEEPSYETG